MIKYYPDNNPIVDYKKGDLRSDKYNMVWKYTNNKWIRDRDENKKHRHISDYPKYIFPFKIYDDPSLPPPTQRARN